MPGFVHTTGTLPEVLYPGLKSIWGDSYKDLPQLYSRFFAVKTSNKRFEKEQGISTFGTAAIKDEGDEVLFDRISQGYQAEYQMLSFGIGALITHEMMQDDQYNVINQVPVLLAKAMRRAEETLATNVLNNAFDTNVTGPDGQALASTAHPNAGISGGTQQNRPTTSSDLTEASLEEALIGISNFRDERGNRINISPKALVVPRSLMFKAKKILGTEYKTESADNDINVISTLGLELVVTNYLDDQDAFFVTTDVPNGLTFYVREEASLDRDNDVSTKNLAIVCYKRMAAGFTDWRGVWCNPGA